MVIPISMSKQQVGIRLLELPPEVAELVESESVPILLLKSSEISTQHAQSSENAVLCTPSKTFQIRQVQSSNVLYILQQTADSGYTAIAQCKGMLEVIPSQDDVLAYIRQQLPIYTQGTTARSSITRNTLHEDTPFSGDEIENALTRLCAFEENGGLWVPAMANLKEAWNSLLRAATIHGVKLDQSWKITDMEKQVMEDQINIDVHRAMVRYLDKSQIRFEARLDARQTTAWVGTVLLGSNEKPTYKRDFIAQWQDVLPESWREIVDMDLLQNKYRTSGDGLVSALDHSKPLDSTKKAAPIAKSKWHQKFQQQK